MFFGKIKEKKVLKYFPGLKIEFQLKKKKMLILQYCNIE